jgi:hypothetical protein
MNRLSRSIYIVCTVGNIIMAKFYLQLCCSVCMSPCGLSLGNRSLVTSEAQQPGQTSSRPLTISSLTIWWPVWAQLSNSQLRLQLYRRKTLHRRSLPGRTLEDSRWLASVVRRLLVLVLARDLVAFLILSRLGLVWTLFLSLSSVWPPASGGKLESPGPLKAVTPGGFGPCDGSYFWQAFSGGHGGGLKHYTSFFQPFLLPAEVNWLTYQVRGERHVELWLSGQNFKWTLFQSEVQMAT